MSMIPRALQIAGLLAVSASLLLPMTFAQTAGDAGSGKDAPGLVANAYELPDYGTYSGYMTTEDRDAYRHTRTHEGPTCISTRATAMPTGDVVLNVTSGGSSRAAYAAFGPGKDTRLAFSAPSSVASSLLFRNGDPADAGDYQFSLSALTADAITRDAGTSGIIRDAPHMLSDAVAITAGCFGGKLSTGDAADIRDAFRFEGVTGATAVLSFAQTTSTNLAQMTLVAPDGTSLARLASGAVEAVTLPTDGTYYLSVSIPVSMSTTSTTYLVGFIDGPPDEHPCRPSCLELA